MKLDFTSLSVPKQVALVSGALALVLSFISSYVRVSYSGGGPVRGMSVGTNAWTSYATLGMLLLVAAIVVVGLLCFASEVLPAGVPWNLAALAAGAVGTVLVILRALTVGGGGFGVSVGPGWSGWLLFVATVAFTASVALMTKASGEKPSDFRTDDQPPTSATDVA